MRIDMIVTGHGTIFLVRPVSRRAKRWIDENVQAEPYQWVGDALAVESRYVLDLVHGAREAGLTIE